MPQPAASVLALLGALALAAPAAAQPASAPERNWGVLLEQDARAMHAAIADSHPGPVNRLNPGFRRTLDDGLTLALSRAASATTQGGWWWALREYEAAFSDGHLALATTPDAPALPSDWPGFLTRFEGREQVVATRLDSADLPPLGARLVSCDGRDAWTLAEDVVGRFRGRWRLASQRQRHGGRLFLDAGNPWVRRPASCVFEADGERRTWTLQWRELPQDELGDRLGATQQGFRAPIERRTLAGNGVWFSAGSFDGGPTSDAYKALRPMIDAAKADPAALRSAPVIVLDLRGNGGGSSAWGYELAEAIWGAPYVEWKSRSTTYVEWRVSDANRAEIAAYGKAMEAEPTADPRAKAWVAEILAGLDAAKAANQPLWKQGDEPLPPAPLPLPAPAFRGRAYVLTDGACASACLDAVDLWKALGAAQVGTETSADTLYMEIRGQALPSGLAHLNLPMKVYRGRARGLNEPHRPTHVFTGDMRDTAALERWIASLP